MKARQFAILAEILADYLTMVGNDPDRKATGDYCGQVTCPNASRTMTLSSVIRFPYKSPDENKGFRFGIKFATKEM